MAFECFVFSSYLWFLSCVIWETKLQVHPVCILEIASEDTWATWTGSGRSRCRPHNSSCEGPAAGGRQACSLSFLLDQDFQWVFVSFFIVSLRYNQLIRLNLWVACVYSELCNDHHNLILEYFYHFKTKLYTLRSHTSFPCIHQTYSLGNLLFVSAD